MRQLWFHTYEENLALGNSAQPVRVYSCDCRKSNELAMNKSESISLRVTEDVKKAVERAARREQLTTAAFVERVLIEGLRQRGHLQPASTPAPAEERKIRGRTTS